MAKIGVNIKIDVTKIDKSRLFKGAKGTYLDLTTFIDLDNKGEHGDNGFITQQVSKEDKAAGVKLPILGNSTVFWSEQPQQQTPQQQAPQQAPPIDDFDSDIPFN